MCKKAMKGMINISATAFFILIIAFSLISFMGFISNFSTSDRLYVFWQGYHLADSFLVKIQTNNLSGDLIVRNVPYQVGTPQEVGRAYMSSNNIIIVSPHPYKYQTRVRIVFSSGSIQEYQVLNIPTN
ncbi:MAG: hypothetical protein ABDH21_05285 [bacterium]